MNRDSHRLRAAAGPVVAVVSSIVAAMQALRLWEWRPGVPLSLSGDAPQILVQVDAILRSDWYQVNHHVGAPFGLNQAWFTTADVLNFSVIKALGLFTDSAATASAVFFLIGFPAAALTAYWLARELGLTRPAAVATGVLFSVIPGHQQWFDHLWLASYWMVPLAVWLIVRVARGEPLLPPHSSLRAGGHVARHARWMTFRTVAIVVAIGLADVYYVAFTLILLGVVLVLRLASGTRAVQLLPGATAAAGIGILCGVSLFAATRGRAGDLVTGALPATRGIGESELYAGKLIELVLPWHEHRAAPLQFLSRAYGIAAPPNVEHPALGLVALVGVVAILWRCVASLATGRRISATWGLLAALTLVSLAFYTKGGLGSVVALFLTPQIRTWSRFVVFIALLGLLAAGLGLSRLGRRHGRSVAWVAAVLVTTVGVLDQTNPAVAPDYRHLALQRTELETYAEHLSDTVGGGCAIFQLPVVAYPEEAPPGNMADYDHLLPSISSPDSLSWSYGAIRGTQRSDWQQALPVSDQRRLLEDVAAAGFCAVSIDRDGYAGSGDPTDLTGDLLGEPVATAAGESLAAYDLRPLAARLSGAGQQRRDAVLRPVVASLGGSLVKLSDGVPSQTTGPTALVTLSNMGAAPVPTTLTFELSSTGPEQRSVTISGPGIQRQVVRVSDTRPQEVSVDLTAPRGSTKVTLEATGGIAPVPGTEGREQAALVVRNLRLSTTVGVNAASLQQFLAASPPSLR
ncbi:hypothetical protein ABEG17_03095 [Pedococcus sp. KACC 23699]|uniref:YfhO family protein n=1 Tax=Pedococcus sp. KACC 23699 TaxID=3149228 RepID=A0AAU7JV81_9MICO